MKKPKFQVGLKFLLVLTLVVAAYLAGRVPLEQKTRQAESRLAAVERQEVQSEMYSKIWRELALKSRDDIRESRLKLRMESVTRFGGGATLSGSGSSEGIRPRAKRWDISYSDDAEVYARQLEHLGIAIVVIWNEPTKVMQWVPGTATLRSIDPQVQIERKLVMAGDDRDFALLPDSMFDAPPSFVLKFMPRETEQKFAMVEHEYHTEEDVTLLEVESTRFELTPSGDGFEISVSDIIRKESN